MRLCYQWATTIRQAMRPDCRGEELGAEPVDNGALSGRRGVALSAQRAAVRPDTLGVGALPCTRLPTTNTTHLPTCPPPTQQRLVRVLIRLQARVLLTLLLLLAVLALRMLLWWVVRGGWRVVVVWPGAVGE